MKSFLLPSVLLFVCILSNAQVPRGFNYQAIARDESGDPIPNANIPVLLTIQSDSLGGIVIWQELHSTVTTNDLGLFSLIVGKGSRQTGTAVTFEAIDWTITPKYIRTEVDYGGWQNLGSTRLWSVPYSMVAKDLSGSVNKLTVEGETADMEEPLFEVKNKNGQTIFAVYNEGVRIYVDDGDAKGLKGGFAIGGLNTAKEAPQDLFIVSPDSIRAYIDTDPAKGLKGGFAIGGLNPAKGNSRYFDVATEATSIINPSQNRILWYPLKNALLNGRILIENPDSVGENSFASGFESKSIGGWSQAPGYKAIARGDYSTAIGKNAVSNSLNSFAFGENSSAILLLVIRQMPPVSFLLPGDLGQMLPETGR